MFKRFIYLISFILVMGLTSNVHAISEPFIVKAFIDQHVCNDTQVGPDDNEQQIGVHVRDIDVRRRVGLFSFDISTVKVEGAVFSNISLSNLGAGSGPIDVYGVIEEQDNLPLETDLVWNNAPGVQNNPTPAVGSPVELDFDDLTEVLLTFTAPGNFVRESTDTSQALADFINSDTDGIITLLFAPPQDGSSAILRAKENDEGGMEGGTFLEGLIVTPLELPLDPNPADGMVDVYRDIVLSWMPGLYAQTHDVYFGTVFDDVTIASRANPLDILAHQDQNANTYAPGRLNFSQTYYWRVDEVNAPPGSEIFNGPVWSFTVEPETYAIEQVTASASSSEEGKGPQNTVNGSGLDESGLLHTDESDDNMWLSSQDGVQPSWIEYELDKVYKLHQMWVWNSNDGLESVIGLGLKDVTIEYSIDGTDYVTLGTTHEFTRAPGVPNYAHNTTVELNGIAAKYVRLTANSNWEGILPQFGLSEVRLFYIPTNAAKPNPASGATDVALGVTLSWRAGREAAEHKLYLSNDEQAVMDGTTDVATMTESNYDPLSLDLGKTYYWRIEEVNEAETPTTWEGDVWHFATREFIVVDDFESYNDINEDEPGSNRIYLAWVDGFDNPAINGSVVGNAAAPFAEQTIVHGGLQSMPMSYDNAVGKSEATLTLTSPRDWTVNGINTLTIWFRGNSDNAAEPMYVVLNDSAVVTNDKPDVALATTWTAWNIELQAFADQGVNLANVTSITLGLGNRNNPVAGGAGMMYFDDIRLYALTP